MAVSDISPDRTCLTVLPNTGQGKRAALRFLKALQDRARGSKAAARAPLAPGSTQAVMERARAECRLMQWVYEVYFTLPPELGHTPTGAYVEVGGRIAERAGGWPTYSHARWRVTAQYLIETFSGMQLVANDEESEQQHLS